MTKSNIFDDHLTRIEHSLSAVLLFYFLVSSTSIKKEKKNPSVTAVPSSLQRKHRSGLTESAAIHPFKTSVCLNTYTQR